MYAKTDDYKATMVPPEWHGAASESPCRCVWLTRERRTAWLHRISDVAPSSENATAVYKHPIYEKPWDPGVEAQVRAACSSESTASDRHLRQMRPISSFSPAVYMPKGYPKNPGGRKDWSVVRRWQPPPLPRS